MVLHVSADLLSRCTDAHGQRIQSPDQEDHRRWN
jgi:hypothetical protein